MRDTTKIGDLSKAMVLAALIRTGRMVLLPFSDGDRYDLVVDDAGSFTRVQCKTGRLRRGAILFNCYSVSRNVSRPYRNEIEAYGIYCPDTGSCYLVPSSVCGVGKGSLRVDPCKATGRTYKSKFAKDFEIRT